MNQLEKTKEVFLHELPSFKEDTIKFLNGEISKVEFKRKSSSFGVYPQREGNLFRTRLRFLGGVVSKEQLHKIYEITEKYNVEKINFTSRQGIQLHNLDVDSLFSIMEECIKNNMFTKGSGGNCPRNLAMSPLSGVNSEDEFDITPYAIEIDKYLINKINTYNLPSKLKISLSSTASDDAHALVQDLGFLAVKKDNKHFFEVYIGGCLGKNPSFGICLDKKIEPKDVLYYVEGLINLFINEASYTDKRKSRLKSIICDLGQEEFIKKYKEYVAREKENKELELNIDEIAYPADLHVVNTVNDRDIFSQKQKGYYSVYIHPADGELKRKDFQTLLNEIDKCQNPSIRLSLTEGMYIINLNEHESKNILEITSSFTASSSLEKSISCIGVPMCQRGLQNTKKLLNEIITYFKENSNDNAILNSMPQIYICGCKNSCSTHQIGAIGIVGKKKRIDDEIYDAFEIFVGGNYNGQKSKFGQSIGDFNPNHIPQFLFEVGTQVAKYNLNFYDYYDLYKDELNKIASKYIK